MKRLAISTILVFSMRGLNAMARDFIPTSRTAPRRASHGMRLVLPIIKTPQLPSAHTFAPGFNSAAHPAFADLLLPVSPALATSYSPEAPKSFQFLGQRQKTLTDRAASLGRPQLHQVALSPSDATAVFYGTRGRSNLAPVLGWLRNTSARVTAKLTLLPALAATALIAHPQSVPAATVEPLISPSPAAPHLLGLHLWSVDGDPRTCWTIVGGVFMLALALALFPRIIRLLPVPIILGASWFLTHNPTAFIFSGMLPLPLLYSYPR